LPVFINDEPVSTGGQFLQLDLAGTELSQKLLGCEIREYSVTMNYIYQNPNIKKSSLDHVLRYVSRIEKLMQDNISLTLTDSTAAVNCRVESTTLEEGLDSYLVSFDWKCQHVSGLSETVATTPALLNDFSISFDGSSDYVDISTIASDINSLSEGSISLWFRSSDKDTVAVLFSASDISDANSDFLIHTNTSGHLKVLSRETTTNLLDRTYETDVVDNIWHHMVFTVNSSGNIMYIDGSAVTLTSAVGDASTQTFFSNVNDIDSVKIGINQDSTGLEYPFNGNIDELAIWDKALSASEVSAIYNQNIGSGTTLDLSYDTTDYTSADNLLAYWRMGSGRYDEFNRIFSKDEAVFGNELWSNKSTSAFYSTPTGSGTDVTIEYTQSTGTYIFTGNGGDTSVLGHLSNHAFTGYEAGLAATLDASSVYKVQYTAKSTGSNESIRVVTGSGFQTFTQNVTSSFVVYTAYVTTDSSPSATDNYIQALNIGSSEKVYVKDISVKKITSSNIGTMTNMEASNISSEVPKQIKNLIEVTNTKSIDFDGTDEYLDIADFTPVDSASAFTVSAWVKCTNTGGTNGIFHKAKTDDFNISFRVSGNTIMFAVEGGSDAFGTFGYTSTSWNHLVAVFNGSGSANADRCKIYLNGASQSLSFTGTIPSAVSDLSDSDTYIGRVGSSYFSGNIDEVAFWNTALDGDAVKAVYNNAKPTDLTMNNGAYDEYTDNLKGYWRMGDGTLDSYQLIADQVNPTLGDELWGDDYSSDVGGWYPYNTNNVSFGDNAVICTGDGSSTNGMYAYLNSAVGNGYGSTTENLVDGLFYKLTCKAKVNSGKTVGLHINNLTGNRIDITSTEYQECVFYFISTSATGNYFRTQSVDDGDIIYIKDISLKKVNGNPALMTNMESGDIEEDTP
jgi:hypothetical protein